MRVPQIYHYYYSNQGAVADPSDIFGDDLKLWINTASADNKTTTGEWDELITSLSSDDPNGYTFDNAVDNEIAYNGDALYTSSDRYLRNTSASNFNLLHNGDSWTLAFRFNPIVAAAESGGAGVSVYPIFMNNGGTTGQTGIAVSYSNASGINAISILVTKSSAGNAVFSYTINGFWTPGSYTSVIITCNGTTLEVFKDGVSQGTSARINTPVTSNATGSFFIGRYSNAVAYAPYCLMKHPVIVSRVITESERTSLGTFLESGSETYGTGDAANFYFFGGQSNAMASDATAPSAALQNTLQSYVLNHPNNTTAFTKTSKFIAYSWGDSYVNASTKFGPDLKFAYDIHSTNPGLTFIAKHAVGGTALESGLTTPDWNVASGTTELAHQSTLQIKHGLLYLKYALNRNVTVRGWMWRLGETEALAGNITHKTDLTNLIKKHLDQIEDLGFSYAKTRVSISLIYHPNYNPARDFSDEIDLMIKDTCDNWATDNPAYPLAGLGYFDCSDLTLSADNTHFVSSAIEIIGGRFTTQLSPYISE